MRKIKISKKIFLALPIIFTSADQIFGGAAAPMGEPPLTILLAIYILENCLGGKEKHNFVKNYKPLPRFVH